MTTEKRLPLRVVVVGFGPVGARFVDEMLPAVRQGDATVTVIGGETSDAYNRVLVAEYAVGRASLDAMMLANSAQLRLDGVEITTGEHVVSIDRTLQTVTLSGGTSVPYDRLVLATGARANVPTLDGIVRERRDRGSLDKYGADLLTRDHTLPEGVCVLRDLADAEIVARAVAARQKIVVVGAGILGLEFALAAQNAGADVCVVHHGDIPMPRNLDRGAGRVLAEAVRGTGVRIIGHSRAEALVLRTDPNDGSRSFAALATADGKTIDGDLLVLSCGVTARTDLALLAGLATAAGIVVGENLASWTDPAIFAIGDCAQVAPHTLGPESGDTRELGGAPSGLIGPGWRQAEWLAQRFSAEASGHTPPDHLPPENAPLVMLKAENIDLVAVGDVTADPWDTDHTPGLPPQRVAVWADPEHGTYLKLLTRGGVLHAFACVGMPRTAAELTLLYQRGSELPADRSTLLRFDGPEHTHSDVDAAGPHDTVCWCNGVTVQEITDSAAEGNTTLECIGSRTRAGTGCGSCRGKITELLASLEPTAQPVV